MDKRRRRRNADASTSIHDLSEDLLEHILLRVSSPIHLLRAAATCKPWRRVIADAGFLRRFPSLHAPQVLTAGHFWATEAAYSRKPDEGGIHFVPSPSCRQAIHLHQRVSFDFLDRLNEPWSDLVLTDSCGGLLAFVRDNWYIILCDPWTKEYRELHFSWTQPDGDYAEHDNYFFVCLGAFFLDADDRISSSKPVMSDFKVLCVRLVQDDHTQGITAEARVFSARDDCWLWSVSTDIGYIYDSVLRLDVYEVFVGRAGGFLFWSGEWGHDLLVVLDESTGEFSTLTLPALDDHINNWDNHLRVVGMREGAVRIVRVTGDNLEVLSWVHGSGECVVERKHGLSELAGIDVTPDRSWCFLDTSVEAAVGLVATSPSSTSVMFSLDVETMKMEPAKERDLYVRRVFEYQLPWPPTIKTCL